jgi:hypothetical protein
MSITSHVFYATKQSLVAAKSPLLVAVTTVTAPIKRHFSHTIYSFSSYRNMQGNVQ